MAADLEYRCFVGGLSWSTSDRDLEEAFRSFGNILEAKVVVDRDTGRSKGFGFVTFDEERAMEAAIDRMHGMDLDGRSITVDKAQTKSGSGGGGIGGGGRGYGGSGGGGGRGYSGGGGAGQECFKCGRPGHWARECPNSGGGGGGRQSGDRYGGLRGDRDGKGDWYGNGGGGGRYNNDRNGDRYGGRSGSYRESGGRGGGERYGGGRGGGERYSGGPARNDGGNYRDRTGPYDRPSGVGSRSYEDRH